MSLDDVLAKLAQAVIDHADIPSASGALRASHQVRVVGEGRVEIVSELPYARAVHDGRAALTIRPNLSKNPRPAKTARLRFEVGGRIVFAREVRQPARPRNPYLSEAFPAAVESMKPEILDYLRALLSA